MTMFKILIAKTPKLVFVSITMTLVNPNYFFNLSTGK